MSHDIQVALPWSGGVAMIIGACVGIISFWVIMRFAPNTQVPLAYPMEDQDMRNTERIEPVLREAFAKAKLGQTVYIVLPTRDQVNDALMFFRDMWKSMSIDSYLQLEIDEEQDVVTFPSQGVIYFKQMDSKMPDRPIRLDGRYSATLYSWVDDPDLANTEGKILC